MRQSGLLSFPVLGHIRCRDGELQRKQAQLITKRSALLLESACRVLGVGS